MLIRNILNRLTRIVRHRFVMYAFPFVGSFVLTLPLASCAYVRQELENAQAVNSALKNDIVAIHDDKVMLCASIASMSTQGRYVYIGDMSFVDLQTMELIVLPADEFEVQCDSYIEYVEDISQQLKTEFMRMQETKDDVKTDVDIETDVETEVETDIDIDSPADSETIDGDALSGDMTETDDISNVDSVLELVDVAQ